MVDFRVVIPARFASSRLPGKPLRELSGKPMVLHVLDRAQEAGARDVLVATDHHGIFDVVTRAGGRAVMTSPDHLTGTDRLAEVARKEQFKEDDIIVNLQGDEPFVPGSLVRELAEALANAREAGIATLATPIQSPEDVFDPNVVKVVLQADGLALYFSRAPIPWARGLFEKGRVAERLPESITYLRHLGLYAYRVGTLLKVADAPAASLESAESLEQLRALTMGVRIHVSITPEAPGHGIDTEADLARAEALLGAARCPSSQQERSQ